MKYMKRNLILMLITVLFVVNGFAQTNTGSTPMAIENMYLLPKKGMEDKFEAAVLAHNKKYHPDGPYVAGLRKIEYGEKAGWYVWVFGPTSYSSIDTRPTKENGHDLDWSSTIDPLVETYGTSTFWNYDVDLSYGWDILKKSKYIETWGVDLKPGQMYRFKALAEKLRKVYESLGNSAFLVLENNVHTTGGADVALVWSFNSFDEWQKDNGPMEGYEKIYGKGSWQQLMDDWKDMIVDYNSEIRSIIK
jgi:hypothetical protein